jgi:hypothetical protein
VEDQNVPARLLNAHRVPELAAGSSAGLCGRLTPRTPLFLEQFEV